MRESTNPFLATGDIPALLEHHRKIYGRLTMTVDPATAAPPANPTSIPVTIDTQTGDVAPQQPVGAPDPAGVWSGDVQPPAGVHTVPAPTTGAQPAVVPVAGQPYVEIDGQRYYTQDFLEDARRQERDKMHQRMETIEQRLAREDAEREERERQIREEAAAAAAQAEQERLASLPLEEKVNELNQMWERRWQERDEADQRRTAIEQQERRFTDLTNYRARRIAEESDLIHPTLVDLVASPETGATSEQEIEESIAALKAKTDAIVGTVQTAQVAQRQQMQGVAPTGTPPVGPLDQTSGQQSLSPADIAAMDPATYAKHRAQLLAAASQHGPYGR